MSASSDRVHRLRLLVVVLLGLALLSTACRADAETAEADRPTPTDTSDGDTADPDTSDPDAADAGTDDSTGSSDEADQNDTDESVTDAQDAGESNPEPDQAPSQPLNDLPRALTVNDVTCALPGSGAPTGLTPQGLSMYENYVNTGARLPEYQLAVDINPETGEVAGAMRATVPAQERTLNFRVFAGMEAFDSGLDIANVTVNGDSVEFSRELALLTIPAATGTDQDTMIELDFSFTIAQMAANTNIFAALSGESLQPDQVGLLGRTPSGMQLGHWFPVWLPDGTRTDPDPSGFGDIGAFPTASICAEITVPEGYSVVTGGARVDTTPTSIIEAALGLRDFSILISNGLEPVSSTFDGVEIRVWGPAENLAARETVLEFAEQSQAALTEAFGPYPWTEIDLVSAPLGSGVGGMEWPGMIWVEQSIFAGGLPGMGDLGAMFGDDETFEELLTSIGGDAIATTLEWTVAHELGHEWWHATVGNDSIASPAVDEPLAQFSACIAMQIIHPDNWRSICESQTIDQYGQARALGIADTAAEQASDEFDSSLQYGAIVYGKAPGFYFETADLIGWPELIAALRDFVEENSFALVSTDALRSHLIDAAGADGAAVGELWDRWFRQAKGDEDIETQDLFGGATIPAFGGLDTEGLEGLDLEGLDLEGFDLEGFDLEGLDLEGLDLEGLDLENLDLEELFGDDSEIFTELLEQFLNPEGTN